MHETYFIFLAAHAFLIFASILRFGLADIRTVLLGMAALYANSYPIDGLFFDIATNGLPSNLIIEISLIFATFSILFFIGGNLTIKSKTKDEKPLHNFDPNKLYNSLFGLSLLAYLLVGSQYWSLALLDRNALYLEPVTILALSKLAVSVYFVATIATKQANGKFSLVVIVGFLIFALVESFVFGDRRIVATSLIAWFVVANCHRRVNLKPTHLLYFFSLAFLFLFIETTRYGGNFLEAITSGGINPALGELGAPWFIAVNIYPDIAIEKASSYSFIEAFSVLIPRSVWPDRPMGASQWFANTYFPEIAAIGGGFAFSLLIEILINLSIIGFVVISFFFGISVANLARPRSTPQRLTLAIWLCSLAFFPRYDSATILKSLAIGYFLIFLPYILTRVRFALGIRKEGSAK